MSLRTEVEQDQTHGQGAAGFPIGVARTVARVATLLVGPGQIPDKLCGDKVTIYPIGGNHQVRELGRERSFRGCLRSGPSQIPL